MSDFRYTPRAVGAIKLHARTMAPATIATIMRCPVSTIELICRKHGIDMRESDFIPEEAPERDRRKEKRLDISLSEVAFVLLAREARHRAIRPNELIERVVEAVAGGHLVAAILDR